VSGSLVLHTPQARIGKGSLCHSLKVTSRGNLISFSYEGATNQEDLC